MAEHVQGSMDSTQSEKTFDGFITFVTRTVIALIVLMAWMALFIR